MFLGRVIGKVVATRKDPALEGLSLMVVLPIDDNRVPAGELLVAADVVGVGQKETVYCVSGREAPCALPTGHGPVDAAIVGIADRIDT